MKNLELSRDVLPIGKLKSRISEMVRRVRLDKRSLVVTHNGAPAAVLVPVEDYDRMVEAERVREAIASGLEDVTQRRTVSDAELSAWASARYAPRRSR